MAESVASVARRYSDARPTVGRAGFSPVSGPMEAAAPAAAVTYQATTTAAG